MGLDASHDCWHGAYSAFRRWRNYVAQVGGFTMVDGDRGPDYELPWDEIPITLDNVAGEWHKPLPDEWSDPLIYLLAHSDCDGVIHPEQGREIAKRLREVLPNMKDDSSGGHIWSMRGVTEKFIAGLETAADAGEDVEFA